MLSYPSPLVARPAPSVAPPTQQQFLISPITGERVPADKLEEHMKHGQKHIYMCTLYSIVMH